MSETTDFNRLLEAAAAARRSCLHTGTRRRLQRCSQACAGLSVGHARPGSPAPLLPAPHFPVDSAPWFGSHMRPRPAGLAPAAGLLPPSTLWYVLQLMYCVSFPTFCQSASAICFRLLCLLPLVLCTHSKKSGMQQKIENLTSAASASISSSSFCRSASAFRAARCRSFFARCRRRLRSALLSSKPCTDGERKTYQDQPWAVTCCMLPAAARPSCAAAAGCGPPGTGIRHENTDMNRK